MISSLKQAFNHPPIAKNNSKKTITFWPPIGRPHMERTKPTSLLKIVRKTHSSSHQGTTPQGEEIKVTSLLNLARKQPLLP